jgi:putative hydrolase of HD superfamily
MTDFDSFHIPSGNARLDAQLKFTAVIDQMTGIFRKTLLVDRSRAENDAEHSWHIAVMALLFEEYAVEKVNTLHAVEMLLVHDLVEIYAGDTFAYDIEGNKTKAQRENAAAEKLFSILPPEQGAKIRALWEEFDAHATPDARYADCLDKLQPYFHNILTEGFTWRNAIAGKRTTRQQVEQRMSPLKDFMPEVYKWVKKSMDEAVKNNWLQV